jgi:ribonuclease HI
MSRIEAPKYSKPMVGENCPNFPVIFDFVYPNRYIWIMEVIKEVTIYTDGGCEPNPGTGGYGAVLMYCGRRKELSGGFRLTTNNRMELYAAIAALEALKEPCKVRLFSDSKYLVEAIEQRWVQKWEKKNWQKAKNPDLWQRITRLCTQHQVKFTWVKGHAGNPNNERCDVLAMKAIKSKILSIDEIYENTIAQASVLEL